MTTLIAERPILTIIGLGLVAAALLFGWLQIGQRGLAAATGFFLVLIPVEWMVASAWVTDREQITALLHDTAARVRDNDVPAAVDVVSDPTKRATVAALLSRFTFSEARVTGIRSIEVNDDFFPPTATSDFLTRIEISGGGIGAQRIPRRVILEWEKQNDQWRIVDYQHLPVVGAADNFSQIR